MSEWRWKPKEARELAEAVKEAYGVLDPEAILRTLKAFDVYMDRLRLDMHEAVRVTRRMEVLEALAEHIEELDRKGAMTRDERRFLDLLKELK